MRYISKGVFILTVFVMCVVMLPASDAWALNLFDFLTCPRKLNACDEDLEICNAELASCMDECHALPGDGYDNPDAFGLSGHGPALSYTDHGDGTFTDNVTGLMWEIKDDNGGIHDVDNDTYTWNDGSDLNDTDPNETLFTVFLNTLNNRCDGDETTACTSNADCVGIGNGLCGHAGYRDWCIPNIKQLQSIVDHTKHDPATMVPGETAFSDQGAEHWSATTLASEPLNVWSISFDDGDVEHPGKLGGGNSARAVRPCQ